MQGHPIACHTQMLLCYQLSCSVTMCCILPGSSCASWPPRWRNMASLASERYWGSLLPLLLQLVCHTTRKKGRNTAKNPELKILPSTHTQTPTPHTHIHTHTPTPTNPHSPTHPLSTTAHTRPSVSLVWDCRVDLPPLGSMMAE